MAKLTDKYGSSSFHGTTIRTTYNKLKKAIGEPQCECNDGRDKTNFDWSCETKDGTFFTIYDWKQYKELGLDERVEFHIGTSKGFESTKAKNELLTLLN
tara:strand:+ start:183 stop:479 length:297 start_codon:yes stop_codon:yes gene_type:complete